MKKGVSLPCTNLLKDGTAFLRARGKAKLVSMEYEDGGVED